MYGLRPFTKTSDISPPTTAPMDPATRGIQDINLRIEECPYCIELLQNTHPGFE